MKLRLVTCLILKQSCCFSQLQLAAIFSDNMVLQRDKPIPIWGKATPGKNISVTFFNETKTVTAKQDSGWMVVFSGKKAEKKPLTLKVSTLHENLEFRNILIGDVWLCIGQSNMEFPMVREMHFKNEMMSSEQPLLRFFNPSYAGKNIFAEAFPEPVLQRLNVRDFYRGSWQQCDSFSIKGMSAVAYYFGKSITGGLDIPVGLINLSIGGAPLETFIDPEVLKKSGQFSSKMEGDWLQNDELPVWVRERARQNVGGLENAPSDAHGKNHGYKPGFAFKAGIEPLLPMAIKGILNYQGESNAQEPERVKEYAALSALMVNSYRKLWKQPKLPYYFVQVSSIDTIKYRGHLWPEFRNEQRNALSMIPYSGMAVCSDIGEKNDVHPANKKDPGERLARWALNQTYGLNIVPSGPLPVEATYKNGKAMVSFSYAADGLGTSDGGKVRGFSLDGKTEIECKIEFDTVMIEVNSKPKFIFYAWKPFSDANLTNSEKLPASTFKIKVR